MATKLSPQKVAKVALALIEQKGLEKFSVRALAAKLKIEPMSVYHYFPSRLALLNAVVDHVLAEITFLPTSEPWRPRLEHASRAWRNLASKYPGFYSFIALHRLNTPNGLKFLEGNMQILLDAGLRKDRAPDYFRIMGYYVTGGALDETTRFTTGPQSLKPMPDAEMAKVFPNVISFSSRYGQERNDAIFELGLKIMIDAIEAESKTARKA